MNEPRSVLKDEVLPMLAKHGICVVSGVHTHDEFLSTCATLGTVFVHRDSDPSGVTVITTRSDLGGRAGYNAFSTQMLELHTDRSTEPVPPNVLAMLYAVNSGAGGELLCVDGRLLETALKEEYPHVYKWAREPRKLFYDDGSTSYEGPIFRDEPDGTTSIRFRADDNGFYPRSAWPNLELFLKVAHSLSLVVRPQKGDMVAIHNGWWLHGRTKYVGQRQLWRMLLHGVCLGRGFTSARSATTLALREVRTT